MTSMTQKAKQKAFTKSLKLLAQFRKKNLNEHVCDKNIWAPGSVDIYLLKQKRRPSRKSIGLLTKNYHVGKSVHAKILKTDI